MTHRPFACLLSLALPLALLAACGGGSPSADLPSVPDMSPSELLSPSLSPSEQPSPSFAGLPGKDPSGATLQERFNPPEGFARADVAAGTFAAWLRALPLKPDGSGVLLSDSSGFLQGAKPAAVLDVPLGNRDNCKTSDAMLLLRGLYLRERGLLAEINFHYLSGFEMPFTKWADGYRVTGSGDPKWGTAPTEDKDDSVAALYKYFETLFSNTNPRAVLAHEMKTADSLDIGDVIFLYGTGTHPVNAAIVADMAVNDASGQIAVILVKGGTGDVSSELYVILNNADTDDPWCAMSAGETFYTAEDAYLLKNARRWK
jgi:hypothetical protein